MGMNLTNRRNEFSWMLEESIDHKIWASAEICLSFSNMIQVFLYLWYKTVSLFNLKYLYVFVAS